MKRSSTNTNRNTNGLQGQYLVSDLNRAWTIDITIVSNKLFFFFIIDLASRRIVHHSVSQHDFNTLEAIDIVNKALEIESQ